MGKNLLLKIVIAVCAAAWIGSLVLAGTVHASRDLIAPFSFVVTVAGGVILLFDRWLWSWRGIALLFKRPDLRGTWQGEILSDWVAPGSIAKPPSIPAFLVVTQTATALHVRQFTEESESITLAVVVMDGTRSVERSLLLEVLGTIGSITREPVGPAGT